MNYVSKNVIRSLHPVTGPYAAVVVLLGFNFYPSMPVLPALLSAVAFAGIAWTIMLFNNIIDRKNDKRKGKRFASKHPGLLVTVLSVMSGLILVLLGLLAIWSPLSALYCGGVWVLGFLYSFMRKFFLIQNAIVGVCSASPILVAGVYYGGIVKEQLLVFFTLFFLIWAKEVYLDIRDRQADTGYKWTLSSDSPSPFVNAFPVCILCSLGWGFALVAYPSFLVKVLAISAGIAAFKFSRLFLHSEDAKLSADFSDRVIMFLLPAVFISQLGIF